MPASILPTILSAVASQAVSSIFGGGKSSSPPPAAVAAIAPPPKVEPVVRMPTSADANAAKKASIAEQLKRRGRASTILTDNQTADTLGA